MRLRLWNPRLAVCPTPTPYPCRGLSMTVRGLASARGPAGGPRVWLPLTLQVLGDQVGFIVLRQVVTSHEALLALRTLKTLITCQGNKSNVQCARGQCLLLQLSLDRSSSRLTPGRARVASSCREGGMHRCMLPFAPSSPCVQLAPRPSPCREMTDLCQAAVGATRKQQRPHMLWSPPPHHLVSKALGGQGGSMLWGYW